MYSLPAQAHAGALLPTSQRRPRLGALLQIYENACDVPGEYHSSAMLIMPPDGPVQNMPLPVVSHQRHKYHVVHIDGHRHLRQRNVYVEDFR